MRNTKQKQIINSVIEQLFHFTSDDLISKVSQIDSTIGRATVFRYLNELIEQKKLQKVHLDKKVVYDNCMHEHNHFVCEKCGKVQRKYLKPGEKPQAEFKSDSDKVIAREYCNLHGLWQKEN